MHAGTIRHTLGGCVVATILAAGPHALAAPQIAVPDCPMLTAWAATVDPNDTYAIAPALPLPRALADEALLPVFGIGALAWTSEDVKAASGGLTACARTAKQQGDKPAMDALGAANAVIAKTLGRTLAAMAKAGKTVETQRAAIDALQDSPELDRALGVLVGVDPAKPNLQAAAGLPREITGPIGAIAKALPHLHDGDREALFAELAGRRTAMQAAMSGSLGDEIAAAAETADGVVALLQIRQRIATMAASEAIAARDQEAADRTDAIRTALRQASPALWVAPDCLDLYRWSGAEGARENVRLGNQATQRAFLDEQAVPLFGVSVGDWSDEDAGRLQAIRATCQATWRALPGSNAVANPPADAPELLRLASKGAWIDGADSQIAQARTTIRDYRAALDTLAAVEAQLASLPDSGASLAEVNRLAQDPSQNAVDDATRQAFQATVSAKRSAITAQAADAAMAGLAEIEVARLDDLARLINYWQSTAYTIPDAAAQQRFSRAAEQALYDATVRMLPEFRARLEETPQTLAGLASVGTAVVDLTGVSGTEEAPAFQPFHAAVASRSAAIREQLRQENCSALLDALDIDADDADQLIWDGDRGTKLGIFVCDLTESGSPVHEIDGGGMFSDTLTMKATLALGGLQTMSLHKAEVAQGQDMLVGFKMADANQERTISVQEWALFTAMATGGRIVTREECERVMSMAEDRLGIEERMIAVDCVEEMTSGYLRFD